MELQNLTKPNGSVLSFRISCSEAEYRPYLLQCSQAAQQKRPITGFRAGKAPLERALSVYGKAILDSAAGIAANEMLRQSVEENEFPVVGRPMFTTVENSIHGLTVDVIVPVYPEVTMGQYKGLSIERPDDGVSDEDVERELDRFCDQHRIVEPSGSPAAEDDIVYFSYDGLCDGMPFHFSHSDRSQIRLGDESKPVFPGLSEALYGTEPGKTYDLELSLPENFRIEEVRGKHISLHVEVQEVLRRRVPEMSDALIAQYCSPLKTVSEYAEDYRQRLEQYRKREADRVFDENIERALVENMDAIVPREMIQSQYEVNYRAFIDGLHAAGTPLDAFLQSGNMTLDTLEAITRQEAERQVRLSLALDKIAELERIEVTPDELNERYTKNLQRGAGAGYTNDDAMQELLSEKAMELVRSTAVPIIVPGNE